MEQRTTMLKVLSPVENKNGKTFWMRVGNAFINRDGSTNVYLNAYPTSGKLQIREFDDRDRYTTVNASSRDAPVTSIDGGTLDHHAQPDISQSDLPF